MLPTLAKTQVKSVHSPSPIRSTSLKTFNEAYMRKYIRDSIINAFEKRDLVPIILNLFDLKKVKKIALDALPNQCHSNILNYRLPYYQSNNIYNNETRRKINEE